jgi:hypothetical protein
MDRVVRIAAQRRRTGNDRARDSRDAAVIRKNYPTSRQNRTPQISIAPGLRGPDAGQLSKESTMAEKEPGSEYQPIPIMQRILDDPFLILTFGLVVPTVFYILWGVMEVVTIPLAK